jgi:hypothetical protein
VVLPLVLAKMNPAKWVRGKKPTVKLLASRVSVALAAGRMSNRRSICLKPPTTSAPRVFASPLCNVNAFWVIDVTSPGGGCNRLPFLFPNFPRFFNFTLALRFMDVIIYAVNEDSESHGFYDGQGKLIYAQQMNDDPSFMFDALFKELGITFIKTKMPSPNGEYPLKITDFSRW